MKGTTISLLFAAPVLLAGPVQTANAASTLSADLIVTHAYLVTMNTSKATYEDGAVVIK
jgi:hypothetical protein